ncbi:MAG: DUF255 domain-containing protein [Candidatus Latescibacteria bacterium]|nr:DUF255 domain-containing protein [Candidatus Latescibacterota bacterium]
MTRWLTVGCAVVLLVVIGRSVLVNVESSHARKTENTGLTWNRYDRGLVLAKQQNKHVLIDFYTDWCGWCKTMDEKTYGDKSIQAILTSKFVLVKVNAESKQTVQVNGKTVTEAQVAAMYRVNGYPMTWFLDPDGKAVSPVSGYVPPDEFSPILTYVGDGWYKRMKFEQFVKRQ